MNDDPSPDLLHDIVDKHVQQLAEFFPHVQVLVSWENHHNTFDICKGSGNWYARQGLARDWINRDEANTLADKMPRPPTEPPDSADDWKGS